MRLPTPPAPHIHGGNRVSLVMQRVLLALVPGIAALVAVLGWGVLVNVVVAVVVAVACEAFMLRLRGRPVRLFLGDWSAVVTAVLLALCLPPLLPAWMTATGVAFGLIFGKHLYGGLGYNPFNPAMVGYVVLLVAFPRAMVQWPAVAPFAETAVGPLQTLQITLLGHWPAGVQPDAITQATPLDHIRTRLGEALTIGELRGGPAFGVLAARGWEWINLLFLAGGLALLWLRVIRWQIPAGVLLGLAIPALVFWSFNPDQYLSPLFHLLSGGAMLGAFFIATDPVSAATTPRGRLLFGCGIGLLAWIIRTWGGYPDGIAFAVLLMNMAVPLIDRATRPRIYGHGGG
ncbi:RnfABCDGE type electron transport complex subunit D [Aquisalimonas lutea]|uniref:RnfABCDGE type electron transport complex subunit D n=1 Tax=Aquisalimonas lutea TaxID=1327750 RepID=UPI0025B424A9|nr:RnfABCDGE type electron transport complex subunit D [Aquisalimonas lutea]MDN3517773.1 RnfABCDGE type electron transport complex subunit D [Aquisalimonas lutea]